MTKSVPYNVLVDAIEQATVGMAVCVPSGDFYRRPEDWTNDWITFVNPDTLLSVLKEWHDAQ